MSTKTCRFVDESIHYVIELISSSSASKFQTIETFFYVILVMISAGKTASDASVSWLNNMHRWSEDKLPRRKFKPRKSDPVIVYQIEYKNVRFWITGDAENQDELLYNIGMAVFKYMAITKGSDWAAEMLYRVQNAIENSRNDHFEVRVSPR